MTTCISFSFDTATQVCKISNKKLIMAGTKMNVAAAASTFKSFERSECNAKKQTICGWMCMRYMTASDGFAFTDQLKGNINEGTPFK